jgi:hypothetical protein
MYSFFDTGLATFGFVLDYLALQNVLALVVVLGVPKFGKPVHTRNFIILLYRDYVYSKIVRDGHCSKIRSDT